MDFVRKDLVEFVPEFVSVVASDCASLNAFEEDLRATLENASKDSSEEFQKNLIAEFLRKSFGYDCNTLGKADLAIYDEGKAKVLFEVKSTQNKAEFVKTPHLSSLRVSEATEAICAESSLRDLPSANRGKLKSCHTERSEVSKHKNADLQYSLDSSLPTEAQNDKVIDCHEKSSDFAGLTSKSRNDAWNLESKAFYESILYYLREFHAHKNNNLKHIILCTAREFYVIKAQEYHAAFVKNPDKAIQKRIDSAYKNCDLKQGNDTSTSKFYEQIAQIVRDMGDRLEFIYVNVLAILGDDLSDNLGDNERERERNSAGAQIAS